MIFLPEKIYLNTTQVILMEIIFLSIEKIFVSTPLELLMNLLSLISSVQNVSKKMSRHERGMSGANNVPLGNRPLGKGATFGKSSSDVLEGGGSLLKPSYLQGSDSSSRHSPPSSKSSRFGNMSGFGGQPPGIDMGEYGGQPPVGNSFNQGYGAGTSAPMPTFNPYQQEPQQTQGIKRPNPALIASINAALGHKSGTAPPPLVSGNLSGAQPAAGAVSPSNDGLGSSERKRKRRSRWGAAEGEKTCIPGMPTVIPSGLSKEQEEAYLLQLKIEDASRRLRTGDFGIPANPEDRSPSPEPIYSSDGKRMNTREYRKRKELEEQRHNDIVRIMEINEDFKPPADYKPPQIKVNDKVMIPQDEHPEINFVGLLIGPRGNTLKSMEKETGAKIIIRGKGSVKEGKVGRKDGQPLPGEDEPLHAYVTATNVEAVRKAVIKINEVIKQGVEIPEGQNDLRKNQLRELALLNGTLREGDQPRCSNCGAEDHKSWQCQDRPNVTNNVVCTTCGGVGHPAKDCVAKRPGTNFGATGPGSNQNMDEEYMSLMAELGEGSVTAPKMENNGSSQSGAKPWQQGNGTGSRTGASMFNSRPSNPRALMAPGEEKGGPAAGRGTNRSQSNNGWSEFGPPGTSSQKPPSLMQQQIPPPWGSQGRGGSNSRQGGNWNQPPPPGSNTGGPARGPPGSGHPQGHWGSSGSGFGVPPPSSNWGASPAGPPPPPPGVGTNAGSSSSKQTSPSSSGSASSSWNVPPWSSGPPPPGVPPPPGPPPVGAPGPVPPPMPRSGQSGTNNPGPPPSWGGWWGPPPPPGTGSSGNQGSGNSSKLLQLVGSAPPPPPPS